jgi:uncharacterized protein (TIGR03435 family)
MKFGPGLLAISALSTVMPIGIGLSNAQSQPERLAFDVASIKQNKSGAPPSGDMLRSNVPLDSGDFFVPTGGFFRATNQSLFQYVIFAYRIIGNQMQYLLPQLPGWVTADRFDIEARVAGNPSKDQLRLMMRSLLADRFKLAIHNETRQVPVFAMVLLKPGKTGPQLQPHSDESSCATPPVGLDSSTIAGGMFPATCGSIYIAMPPSAPGLRHSGARRVTIGLIANLLNGIGNLGRPVLDQTGLSGTFDFSLEWTPEASGPLSPGVDSPDPSGATFLQALRDQLGLKLESTKGPVEILVVDHVERPSEN